MTGEMRVELRESKSFATYIIGTHARIDNIHILYCIRKFFIFFNTKAPMSSALIYPSQPQQMKSCNYAWLWAACWSAVAFLLRYGALLSEMLRLSSPGGSNSFLNGMWLWIQELFEGLKTCPTEGKWQGASAEDLLIKLALGSMLASLSGIATTIRSRTTPEAGGIMGHQLRAPLNPSCITAILCLGV